MKKHLVATLRLAIIAMIILPACTKVTVECEYVILPLIERKSIVESSTGEDSIAVKTDTAINVIVHAHYADTSLWAVNSYDDALAGTLTHKADNTTRTPDFSSEQDSDSKVRLGPLTSKEFILVICYGDDQERIYGWRMANIGENMSLVSISVTGQPYMEQSGEPLTNYVNSNWNMVNENSSEEPSLTSSDT